MERSKELSMDQAFLKKLTDSVFDHLTNEQFGAEELASDIGMSRSQIHRKLQKIKGQSVTHFIREIRLKEAHQLLERNTGTASEIAYQVGFGSPTYFNRCFHEFYGYTPGDVKKRAENTADPTRQSPGNLEITDFKRKKSIGAALMFWQSRNTLPVHILTGIIFALLLLIIYLLLNYYLPQHSSVLAGSSIAVLPYKNLSNNPEDQYLADGMMESILNHLQRIEELRVRSRNATENYRASSKSIKTIGKELDVDYILRGSFQKSGEKANLTVQLIDTKTDELIWTHEYMKDWSDIFAVQKDVAESIANELYVTLSNETETAWKTIPTTNMQAYDLYLKGREVLSDYGTSYDEQKLIEAKPFFAEAIELDRDFSLAYTALGHVEQRLSQSPNDLENSTKIIQKAINLDPYNGWAYVLMSETLRILYWDSAAARQNLDLALILEPNNPAVYNANFEHEYVLGNFEKFVKIYDQFVYRFNINPVNIPSLKLLRCQKKYEEMAKIADDNLDAARSWGLLRMFFYGYLYTDDFRKADLMIQYMWKYVKDKRLILPCQGMLYAREDNDEGALAIVDSLNVLSMDLDVSGVTYAQIYATMGEEELMYHHLEDALAKRHIEMTYLYKRPAFDPYRNEPRFQDIWRRTWIPIYKSQ